MPGFNAVFAGRPWPGLTMNSVLGPRSLQRQFVLTPPRLRNEIFRG
jgi:hypothetical protein